jgi:hypothetical protein
MKFTISITYIMVVFVYVLAAIAIEMAKHNDKHIHGLQKSLAEHIWECRDCRRNEEDVTLYNMTVYDSNGNQIGGSNGHRRTSQ